VANDHGPVIESALLRNELVRLRKDSEKTQEQVAGALEWSPSKLIRVEGGRSSITKVDLDALLTEYGVTSESHRDRLQALNRGARERGWWDDYKDDISPDYLSYVGFEAGAASIKQFQLGVIPGLLQTAKYARTVAAIGSTAIGSDDEDRIASVVGLRLERQARLSERSVPPRQYFVLDEAVIRRYVGVKTDPSIMPDQLCSLANRAQRDNLVTVRVIPFDAGAHSGLSDEPFTLLEFEAGLPDILYVDVNRGATKITGGDEPQVERRKREFEDLLEAALPAPESIDLIRNVADEMSRPESRSATVSNNNVK
jgi:transcriptional regulator with XRE-family HTH domain